MDINLSLGARQTPARRRRIAEVGQRISAELEAFAAASRARLDSIDREHPEAPAQ